jgi:hypothetical protein
MKGLALRGPFFMVRRVQAPPFSGSLFHELIA